MITRDARKTLRTLRTMRIDMARAGIIKKRVPRHRKPPTARETGCILLEAVHEDLERIISRARRGNFDDALWALGLDLGMQLTFDAIEEYAPGTFKDLPRE